MATIEEKTKTVATMGLDAGQLSLNFANTMDWHASDQPVECLTAYPDLITFGRRTETLTEAEARRLAAAAAAHPEQAAQTLEAAIVLREAIYEIFESLAHGGSPAPAALDRLNRFLSRALSQARVVAKAEGFDWDWAEGDEALDQMLWPVAKSAAELLTSADRERVGQCADDRGCGWLFLDTSRNHSRRWCDMKDCGNRAKARRHYHRQRQAQR